MAGLRRLFFAVVVLAAAAGFSSRGALAAGPPPPCYPPMPQSLASTHFTVYYTGDPTDPAYITESQAGDILAAAEHAYDTYTALGFPAPFVGRSGTTEFYVIDLSSFKLASYICPGGVDFDSGDVGQADTAYSVGFDVFEELEDSLYLPPGLSDPWLTQGIASWASWKALGYPAESTASIGPLEMSLDCYDVTFGSAKCSKVGVEDDGESRWPFYEYLAERFGNHFIIDLLNAAQAARGSLQGLQNALVAKGTTLPAAYGAYTTKLVAGGWTAASLNLAVPPVSGTAVHAGAATGDTPAQAFGVNHLATRFIEIDRGDGDASHPCYAATLTIHVQIPAGVTSQPVFLWNANGTSPVALNVSGRNATASVPWDTCVWQNKGYLSLPNTTTTANGNTFLVWTHIDVNTSAPATATPPPAQTPVFGPSVDVPSNVAPEITLFGPELLRLSAAATQLRIIVQSNAEGSLLVRLGALTLGTASLRPGGNDLRFTLPKGVIARLRTSASTNLLTLTPTSADGTATGTVVTRKIAITPAKKPKPKQKLRSK